MWDKRETETGDSPQVAFYQFKMHYVVLEEDVFIRRERSSLTNYIYLNKPNKQNLFVFMTV